MAARRRGTTGEAMTRRKGIEAEMAGYGIQSPLAQQGEQYQGLPVMAAAQLMQQDPEANPFFAGPTLPRSQRTRMYNQAIGAGTPGNRPEPMSDAEALDLAYSAMPAPAVQRMAMDNVGMQRAMQDRINTGAFANAVDAQRAEMQAAEQQAVNARLNQQKQQALERTMGLVGENSNAGWERVPAPGQEGLPESQQRMMIRRRLASPESAPESEFTVPGNVSQPPQAPTVVGSTAIPPFPGLPNEVQQQQPTMPTDAERRAELARISGRSSIDSLPDDINANIRRRRAERADLVASRRPQTLPALQRELMAGMARGVADRMANAPGELSDAEMLFAFGAPGAALQASKAQAQNELEKARIQAEAEAAQAAADREQTQALAQQAGEQSRYGFWGSVLPPLITGAPALLAGMSDEMKDFLYGKMKDYIGSAFPSPPPRMPPSGSTATLPTAPKKSAVPKPVTSTRRKPTKSTRDLYGWGTPY
jgi:hypothetical protein